MSKIDFCSMKSVTKGILKCLLLVRPKIPQIPPLLVLLSKNRPGMSSSKTTGSIISRFSEAGITNSSPEEEKKIRIIIEEIFDAITQDAKIDVSIPPGTSVTVAPNLPGATVGIASGNGIIS